MLASLALLLIPTARVLASSVDEWISEMFIAQRSIAGIFESSPVGLRYSRGFPRGVWGTNLAPDLGAYDEGRKKFLVNGEFQKTPQSSALKCYLHCNNSESA